MNPTTQELIAASKNLLGLVFGLRMEKQRALEELPPIVPKMFLTIAAEQAVARLDRAVQACGEMERIAGEKTASATDGYKAALGVVNAKIEYSCQWLGFSGRAGSMEYATQVCEWLGREFGGNFCVRSENGWHYAEGVA